MFSPNLVDSDVSFFHRKKLQLCHTKKMNYYNNLYNIFLLLMFIIIFISVLYYKYKGKLTPKEKFIKQQKERIHILNKIRSIKIEKQKYNQQIITDLPRFDNEYTYLNEKYL